MNNIEKIFHENKSFFIEYSNKYILYLSTILKKIDFEMVNKIINVLLNAKENGKKIYFIGNGGSASTSSHFAEDLSMGTYVNDRNPFKAISLTENVAYMTALGNDKSFEDIFSDQLKVFLDSGDVVIGISASGNSPNLIKAMKYVNKKNGISICLVGFDGGKMKDICKYSVYIDTMKNEYGPVEDVHIILCHIITTYLKFKLIDENDA